MARRIVYWVILLLTAEGFIFCRQDSSTSTPRKTPLPEYTADEAGQWNDLKATHVPVFEYHRDLPTDNLLVFVNYRDKDPRHRVEMIGLIDENQRDVVPPTRFGDRLDYYQAKFTIRSFPEASNRKWKIYVRCTQHDVWTRVISDTDK